MGRDGDGVDVRETSIRLKFTYPAGVTRRETLMLDGVVLLPTVPNVKLAHRMAKDIRTANRAAAYYASGGGKVWAQGMLAELNKGLHKKLTMEGMEA